MDSQIVGQKALKIKITNKRLRYDIPNDLNNRLSNVILTKIIRRGKYLIFLYRNKQYLLIHLGMTGYFRVSKKIENRLHDHIHFLFYDKTLVFNDVRKFGFFKVYSKNEFLKSSHLKNMGPEPLEEKFNLDYFKKNKNRETSIKNLLMNQKFVAGLGNIYCSEILFDAGIHPEKRIKALKERDMIIILRSTKKILNKAIKHGGTTIKNFIVSNEKIGYFKDKLKVYGRFDQECLRCLGEQRVLKIRQSGRSSFFCSKCQKLE